RFDTVSWLAPGGTLIDLPRGVESELLIGTGRDERAGRPASHIDGWAGRVWAPSRGAVVLGDVWGSGYVGDDLLRASTVRASLTGVHHASEGLWAVRLGGERLIEPHPDV